METTESVLRECRALGFARMGIARAEPTQYAEELRSWLAGGQHGEMAYLERHEDILIDPNALLPEGRSIICVADRYWSADAAMPLPEVGQHSPHSARESDQPRGIIARYARGEDYHEVMKKRLHQLAGQLRQRWPDEKFRVCVDTAPLLEREYAERAGIGSVGKHTLIIERGVGSWLLLGEIVTTLELEPATPSPPDPCGSCTRCIDACPTDAITPFSVDATKCISYLTIEHRSAIDEKYHEPIGQWIFGCDICQEVCPHNWPTRRTKLAPVHEAYVPRRAGFHLLEVLGWSEDDRRAAFTKSAMKRAKLWMMKRNALIALGNVLRERDDPIVRKRIAEIAANENEHDVVRETARTVLSRLNRD